MSMLDWRGIPVVRCRWCEGRGCLYCQPPAALPELPEPLFSVSALPDEDPGGWRILRDVFGREAMDKAFGPGGGGMEEVLANLDRAKEQRR